MNLKMKNHSEELGSHFIPHDKNVWKSKTKLISERRKLIAEFIEKKVIEYVRKYAGL